MCYFRYEMFYGFDNYFTIDSFDEGHGPREGDDDGDGMPGSQAPAGVYEGRQFGGEQGIFPTMYSRTPVFAQCRLLQRLCRVFASKYDHNHEALLREYYHGVT